MFSWWCRSSPIKFVSQRKASVLNYTASGQEKGSNNQNLPRRGKNKARALEIPLINKHLHFCKLISPQEISLVLIILPYVMFYKRYMSFIDFLIKALAVSKNAACRLRLWRKRRGRMYHYLKCNIFILFHVSDKEIDETACCI